MSKTSDIIADYDQFVLNTYTRSPMAAVKGDGSWIWDADGKKYLDFFPGWGVSNLGHCHPRVVTAVREQAGRLLHMPNNFFNELQGRLARTIVEKAFPGKVFFANSGAEANEGAIKLARRFGDLDGRFEILTMKASFHGRTLATVTATGQEKYQAGFGPLPSGFRHLPFNDISAVKKAIGARTVAVMLELVQGEGGVHPALPEYVRELREICDARRLLMIVDEVQTGMARTGNYFAFQHYGVEPDLMSLAKALAGGLPIGALVVRESLSGLLPPGSHASTFGGNPLVCAAALAVFAAIEEEKILENVRRMSDYLWKKLERMRAEFALIREVRGLGLMLGMECDRECKPVADACLEKGLIVNCTAGTVLRLMPACNIRPEEIDLGVEILREALGEQAAKDKRLG